MNAAVTRLPEPQIEPLLIGYGFEIARRRRMTVIGLVVLGICILAAAWVAEVEPGKFLDNLPRFTSYIGRIFLLDDGRFVLADPVEWYWGLGKWLGKLGDTLLIAYLGTFIGTIGAFLSCFSASSNLATGHAMRFAMRRLLEFCRTVPELVFALLFVVAFGLGPVPGVLAVAIHTYGALGKLFSEVVENIDMKPVEGATASGGSRWQTIRYAVVPQVLSNFASYALLRFEINVRGAAVMGFVGAGGIGQDLIEAVRKFYYSDVSAILCLVIGTVMLIDLGTERLRHRLIATERKT
ncbi:MAG TPA: phosphonate ABC transporter, permease protein PhnE [Rhabdaerophilum sp.]|nr:phosphonate ABC transporter, permease protein PhnE [Rhabdaerophilum sp.]